MLKKWFKRYDLVSGLIYALAAVVIGMIATALFVAWIAAKSGAPVPTV